MESNWKFDHLVRPIDGGKNTLENLRTVCSACNIGRWHAEQKYLFTKAHLREVHRNFHGINS